MVVAITFALSGCVLPLLPSSVEAPAPSPAQTAVPSPTATPDLTGSAVLSTEPFASLVSGQCTDVSANSQLYDSVNVLDCGLSHASEVFHTFVLPAGPFPAQDKVSALADAGCATAFNRNVPNWLTYVWVGPTADSWRVGDRSVVCFAIDPNNAALTSPLSELGAPQPLKLPDLRGVFAIIAGILVIMSWILLILVIASYVVWSIGLTRLFRKVGIPVWKAWVPYVQTWTLLRLGGQNGNWMWLFLVPYGSLVTSVFVYIGMHRIGIAFNKDTGTLILGILLPWVWAFMLGGPSEVYRPDLLALRGYPPPLEGYGSPPPAQAGF